MALALSKYYVSMRLGGLFFIMYQWFVLENGLTPCNIQTYINIGSMCIV